VRIVPRLHLGHSPGSLGRYLLVPPHYHGEVDDQTSGGAFGMIVVEDESDQISSWAYPDNEILLQISDTGSLKANVNTDEVIAISGDRWYRLRVSAVVPRANPKDLGFDGDACTVYKVASHGVWHTEDVGTYSGSSFEMTGASRADFAIKCTANTYVKWGPKQAATLTVNGSYPNPEGDLLGSPPSKPAALTGIAISVPSTNQYRVSINAA
jgi:hypothetical protein